MSTPASGVTAGSGLGSIRWDGRQALTSRSPLVLRDCLWLGMIGEFPGSLQVGVAALRKSAAVGADVRGSTGVRGAIVPIVVGVVRIGPCRPIIGRGRDAQVIGVDKSDNAVDVDLAPSVGAATSIDYPAGRDHLDDVVVIAWPGAQIKIIEDHGWCGGGPSGRERQETHAHYGAIPRVHVLDSVSY